MSGRRVFLRPPDPADYAWIYPIATGGTTAQLWRLRGTVPPPEAFAQKLWAGVEAQFIVCALSDSEPLGLVQFLAVDTRSQHGALSVLMRPEAQSAGWPLEGVTLFIDYVFATWPMRKLYLESLDAALDSYKSAVGLLLEEEGIFREHEYCDGRWMDLHVLALYRKPWEERRARLVDAARRLEA